MVVVFGRSETQSLMDMRVTREERKENRSHSDVGRRDDTEVHSTCM